MKKYLIPFLLVISTIAYAEDTALTVKEIKENLEGSVRAMDWYTKGDTQFAESENDVSRTEVALSENKGYAEIKLSRPQDYGISIYTCYKLADLIPHQRTNGWNDEPSEDEQVIKAVFNPELPQYKNAEGELNGWKLSINRGFDTIECSAVKI